MIGETIGNFRLVSRLGRGGMGEVYLAEHKDLQTPVAVKLLNPEISEDRDHVQRFFNEARVVSKIRHAGTVKIFDSGFHKEQAYLIMELLEGESLAGRLANGPLDAARVLDISRQIASVLDATHRQGVIHRDLKPDNIYLVIDDERASGERVKVLDFGIAKLSGTLAGVSPKTSGTMGTPAYMAPEQWGDSGQVDWRADAYSLGCVMFELACGRPPFQAATIAQAFTQHVHTKPPAPRSLVPDLPEALEALILRLLAKDPAERAVSMGQVTRELAELMGETAEPPARTSRPMRAPTPPPDTVTTAPSSPKALAIPPPTMTTLGASAAELHIAKASRRPALIGGLVAGAVVIGVLVVAMTRSSDNSHPATPPSSATEPAPPAVAAPVVTPPTPPVATTPPPDAAVPVVTTPPPDAAAPVATTPPPLTPPLTATRPHHPPKPPATKPPEPTKPPKPPEPAKPPPDDMGGRL